MTAEPDGEDHTIEGRLESAAVAWGALLQGGREHTGHVGRASAPTTGEAVRDVLKRQGSGKSRGAGGWGPAKLHMLPDTWLDRLGEFIWQWGREVRWPIDIVQCCLRHDTQVQGAERITTPTEWTAPVCVPRLHGHTLGAAHRMVRPDP